MDGQVAGLADGRVDGQGQRCGGIAAVTRGIDGDHGDVVAAVGQRGRRGRQEEAPAVIG